MNNRNDAISWTKATERIHTNLSASSASAGTWIARLGFVAAATGAILAAEVTAQYVGLAAGRWAYAGLLLVLLLLTRLVDPRGLLAITFSIVVLSRLIVMLAPQPDLGPYVNLLLSNILILLTTLGALRVGRLPLIALFNPRPLRILPLLLMIGFAIAYLVAATIALPAANLSSATSAAMHLSALATAAFAEELLFRGLLLSALVRSIGARGGIALSAILYGGLHLRWESWAMVGLMLVMGLFLAYVVVRSRSTLPALTIHIAMNISLPFLASAS